MSHAFYNFNMCSIAFPLSLLVSDDLRPDHCHGVHGAAAELWSLKVLQFRSICPGKHLDDHHRVDSWRLQPDFPVQGSLLLSLSMLLVLLVAGCCCCWLLYYNQGKKNSTEETIQTNLPTYLWMDTEWNGHSRRFTRFTFHWHF